MNPPLAARLVAPPWKAFGDRIPTNPQSSWDSYPEYAPETNTVWGVPADTASTRIESSSAVHLELVAMFSVV